MQTNLPLEEVRKNIWLVDSKGLIVRSRKESLQHFKKPWAHEHEPVKNLLDAVNVWSIFLFIKPRHMRTQKFPFRYIFNVIFSEN
jgi:hypothetical protein